MHQPLVPRALGFAQRTLTWSMMAAYAAALLLPGPGLRLRHLALGAPGTPTTRITLPSLLLALVLFSAALHVPLRALPALARRPLPLLIGTAVNAAVPLISLPALALVLHFSPDADGGSGLLTGMALVGAMPVAGGASVWGSRAGGNHSLVVGIILTSTLLSPLTIPLTLSTASMLAHGHYARDLGGMAHAGGGAFAAAGVLAPCLAGLLVQRLVPDRLLARALPSWKLGALAGTLMLTYGNACGALTGQLHHPQPAFVAASIAVAAGTCVASFAVGWALARGLRSDPPDTVSITLASGMNNSSASAVFAAAHLPAYPQVLMPVLAYSLLQKLGAGATDALLHRRRERRPAPGGAAERPEGAAARG
ncbi:bile acid:sodium symporter family protein [Streptomyces sp. NPDC051569]|uniref:bile acid:sodium symporter family protein n=1 Tax=Streptomyces sp. NPDC051569 TaxID=3365661 RepID=UPI0037B84644